MQPIGKSGPLSYSRNYVWNKKDCVGKGATAEVFLGRHRQTGENCAIKLFNVREFMTLAASSKREIELLGKLKHRNVITFLASETELSTGNEILVTPYCQGGSLFSMLEQPQYAYGFPEDEFLIFLGDTSRGMEYLRSLGITHRDIKPGNIMKFIDKSGRSVYKLTDFGAARELKDEEKFQSLYGTEEYLHPDMYQRAILKEPGSQFFDASVDLWSFGCTIYHVATGQLPFQAHGGRINTVVMHKITSEKASGVISGIQTEPNGAITWSKDLPNTCLLPQSLKKLLTPVLAGLMETDKSKAWSFEQSFSHVKSIISRKRMEIFYQAACLELILYMREDDKYCNIQEEAAQYTGVIPENQLLLFRDKEFCNYVSATEKICNYPRKAFEGDIYLFNRDTLAEMNIYVPETVPFPSRIPTSDLIEDVELAKLRCSVAYFYEFHTEKVVRCQQRVKQSVFYLRDYIRDYLNPINVWLTETKKLKAESERTLGILDSSLKLFGSMLPVLNLTSYKDIEKVVEFANKQDVVDNLKGSLAKEDKRINEIDVYLQVLLEKIKEQDPVVTSVGWQEEQFWVSTIKQFRLTINGVLSTFRKHKRYGDLHPHEVFIHQAEMQKLEESNLQILSVFQGYLDNLKRICGEVKKHSGLLLKHLTRAKKVEVNMKCVIDFHKEIDIRLGKLDETYKEAALTLPQLLGSHAIEVLPSKNDGNSFLVKQAASTQESTSKGKISQCGATDFTDKQLISTPSPASKSKMYCDLARQLNETRLETESTMKNLTENKKGLESIVTMLQNGGEC
ncbi:hypothetical protein CHS0354_009564 [Potamilus streckersoni]|uniref:Protein kinase domain-containing protein n=1 Tax=Potamilus streckersoni TaxID=2493646 RepID=A0AAE0W0A8_9BIVA|nr:hypothetical protein CHS0354_009564 [Potamilus streckersoni]